MNRHEPHPIPDAKHIIRLMKKHGEILLEPCPTSEELVLYCDEADILNDRLKFKIKQHLDLCFDCQDRVHWLTDPASDQTFMPSTPDKTITLKVQLHASDRISENNPLAYAATSNVFEAPLPSVPYIKNDDGSIYGEIGQDLDSRIFLCLECLPGQFRGHVIQVCVTTHDHRTFTNKYKALNSKIIIVQRIDVTPEDLAQVELRFTDLRHR